MAKIDDMKKTAKKAVGGMIRADFKKDYGDSDLFLLNLGLHPSQAAIEAQINATAGQLTAIENAANEAALKATMKAFLDGRGDGESFKRMFGKDDIID